MKILFSGNGKSGSWKIRGDQLGNACNGIIKPHATLDDIKQADVVVVVKRVTSQLLSDLQKAGKPWIFDVVDFYPQPACTSWTRGHAISWVRNKISEYKPNGIIWPNKCMEYDCSLPDIKSIVLPHHYRPNIRINPIRESIKTIGYEGSRDYIGSWLYPIQKECLYRGWNFIINPLHLADLDIVLAVRDKSVAGYCQRHWKSNVKLANAHGSGTPFIGNLEQSYLETATHYEQFADCKIGLKRAFDALDNYEIRKATQRSFLKASISVDEIAKKLIGFANGL
jgi:hypothetical protein